MDLETTSGNPDRHTKHVWEGHCGIAGVAFKYLGDSTAYYLPFEGKFTAYRTEGLREWLEDLLRETPQWINANVKYDVHVLYRNGIDTPRSVELVDITTMSKLVDSDRMYKGGYGLDQLSLWLLNEDIRPYERKIKEMLGTSKDYGDCPPPVMADYATVDVVTAEHVYTALQLPEVSKQVWETEKELTWELVYTERGGMRVDREKTEKLRKESGARLFQIYGELWKHTKCVVMPGSSKDVGDYLVNQCGLPAIYAEDDEDEEGQPSMAKAVLSDYLTYDNAPHEAIKLILEYRKLTKFMNSFLDIFLEASDDRGYLRGTYNQSVKTGRLSCSRPNNMQFSPAAKELIIPPEGYVAFSIDSSQIEYRLLTHYTQEPALVRAYLSNVDTDFHSKTSEMASCGRKMAKLLNFLSSYGGGKDKFFAQLRMENKQLSKAESDSIYATYHRGFPSLKSTSRRLSDIAWNKGYVVNLFGRVRRLERTIPGGKYSPTKDALNTLCQGTAADILKEIMVTRICPMVRKLNGWVFAQVHDDISGYIPIEVAQDPEWEVKLAWCMEEPLKRWLKPMTIPLRSRQGWSDKNWKEASSVEKLIPYEEVRRYANTVASN